MQGERYKRVSQYANEFSTTDVHHVIFGTNKKTDRLTVPSLIFTFQGDEKNLPCFQFDLPYHFVPFFHPDDQLMDPWSQEQIDGFGPSDHRHQGPLTVAGE